MAPKRGALHFTLTAEALWTVTITTTAGGPTVVNILAADATSTVYDLCAAMKIALDAAAIGTWTVTPSFGESGTGKVTITCNQATYTLAWTSTNARDALGFTASVTQVAATQTGANAAKGVFLPDCVKWTAHGDNDPGDEVTDLLYTSDGNGNVTTTSGGETKTMLTVRWSHLSRARARYVGETTVNASWQTVWRDCHRGDLAYCLPGATARLVWDADVPATYHTYQIVDRQRSGEVTAVQNWNGLYTLELQLVLVPS
jgi:hypothetical protein